MSRDDVLAESGIAPAVTAATGLPLVGLTLGAIDATWSARFWDRTGPRQYRPDWVQSIRVVGSTLSVSFNKHIHPIPAFLPYQARTISAWGAERQAILARLKVGLIGAGSVGVLVAEALMRTGIHNIDLFDFDIVEEHNLDRLMCTGRKDIGQPKARVLSKRLADNAPSDNFNIAAHEVSICEEEGYRRALDCDVLFSCVDRPWPRSTLNFIAYAHLVPVIDGGISVSRRTANEYRGAEWRAHTVGPGNRCLRCLKQFDPGHVATEREGLLDDPKYLKSLRDDHPLRGSQNVFAFSQAAAALEVLQLVMLAVPPTGLGVPGSQTYHLATGQIDLDIRSCESGCDYSELVALGDFAGGGGTARHTAAETARALYPLAPRGNPSRMAGWLRRVLGTNH